MKSIHDHRYAQTVQLLIQARVAANVTQAELAARLHKQQSYVAKVENLDRRIDVIELADWLYALETSPQTFVDQLGWWR